MSINDLTMTTLIKKFKLLMVITMMTGIDIRKHSIIP